MSSYPPRVAFINAPFSASHTPSIGISLLKSALSRQGIACDIHYLNLKLAQEIGVTFCDQVANDIPAKLLLGEWLFAPSLFGENPEADRQYVEDILWGEFKEQFSPAVMNGLLAIRERLPAFLDRYTETVDWSRYALVGFSSSFHQQCASLALARRIRSRYPDVSILFGGANCFGTMGMALARLFPFIDYVCTGEGDLAVPQLVGAILAGERVPVIPGIITRHGNDPIRMTGGSARITDMDSLPYPDYTDYFRTLKSVPTPPSFQVQVLMETSRGCWWGEKSPCTFCGLNALENVFRCKSPGRVLDELQYLCSHYGREITFVDTCLTPRYFHNVIPELAHEAGLTLFWEVNAALTHEQVQLLALAGVKKIQAGIESFSDPVLRLMGKGTTLIHNIQLLKWGRQAGIHVSYNLLWGFPGEEPGEYAAMERLVPLLIHLDPPGRYGPLHFDRFSRYWQDPGAYGIARLTPLPAYPCVFPTIAPEEIDDLAYYFEAEFPDNSAHYTRGLAAVLNEWQLSTGAGLDAFADDNGLRILDARNS